MDTSFGIGYLESHGYYFGELDLRHQDRYHTLVKEHTHAINAAVSGLSALPGTAQSFAATRAMSRFLNHPGIGLPALIEPAQDAIRTELARTTPTWALCVHDWSLFQFHTHTAKTDRLRRSHDKDLGYELGSAVIVDAADGRPLGAMELRLRTGTGLLSTRVGVTSHPSGHVDELLEVMDESRRWQLNTRLIHVMDREADSIGHYRLWAAKGHRFLVRADDDRTVLWNKVEWSLTEVVSGLSLKFRETMTPEGQPETITLRTGTGRIQVAETEVVLHRPAKKTVPGEFTAGGHKKKVDVPGEPLTLRFVVTRVVSVVGTVLAEWRLFTNVSATEASAAMVGQWYAWRWAIETYHKLLKTAGLNAEEWQQDCGEAFLRRLCLGTMACLTVWHLQRDGSDEAVRLRKLLVRLSGRQMKHRVESTAPALLAGLEKLLAIDNLLQNEDWDEVLALARKVLPRLFQSG